MNTIEVTFYGPIDPLHPFSKDELFEIICLHENHYTIRRITDTLLYLRVLDCLQEKIHLTIEAFRQHLEAITDDRIEGACKTDTTRIFDYDYALERLVVAKCKEAEGVEKSGQPLYEITRQINYCMPEDQDMASQLIDVFQSVKEALDAKRESEDRA